MRTQPYPKLQKLIALSAIIFLLSGCTQDATPEPTEPQSNAWSGQVLEVNPETNTFKVRAKDSEAIEVEVFQGDAMVYKRGDYIRGTLQTNPHYRLESIWPANPITERILKDRNEQLRRDTVARGLKAFRGVGEYTPLFALYNQDAALMTPERWRGRRVVLNFVFTRCTIPTMCPASTARMARLQREAKKEGLSDLQLATITFDPQYDTPGILKYYAVSRGIDNTNYDFLTGPHSTVQDVLKQFGILVQPEDGTLDHTMATLIIDGQGKIRYRKDGSRWSVEEFIDQLKKIEPIS